MRKRSFFTPVLWVPLLACSSKDTHHTVTTPDSSMGSGSGSNVTCKAAATYSPTFGSDNSDATNVPAMAGSGSGSGSGGTIHFEYFDGLLSGSDVLDITLYSHYGGFGSGDIATGTYPLTGDDGDFAACGLCVDVMPGAFDGSGIDFSDAYLMTEQYIASSGSITLGSVNGTLTGSISGVTFKHINLDSSLDNQSYPDSCSTQITSASFSAPLGMGSAAIANFAGTTDEGQQIRVHLGNRHR